MHTLPLALLLVVPIARPGASTPPAAASVSTSFEPAAPAPSATQGRGRGRIKVPGGRSTGRRAGASGRAEGPGAGRKTAGRSGPPEPPTMPDEELERAKIYFRAADRDGNGWLGLSEAILALELDRRRFSQFDRNSDGRIAAPEFQTAYRKTWERIGAFKPPIVEPGSEGERLLADLQNLEVDEEGEAIEQGHDVLPPEERAESLEALFGRLEDRNLGEGGAPAPPRVRGPVPLFLRLDMDRDGGLTAVDLDILSRPLQLPVRPNTVLASLDANEDGHIDPDELARSLGETPRR